MASRPDVNKCLPCAGTGQVVGLGMMRQDCRYCNGDGILDLKADAKSVKSKVVDKRSAEYKAAIKKIMESGSSREEAARIFDEEYTKL